MPTSLEAQTMTCHWYEIDTASLRESHLRRVELEEPVESQKNLRGWRVHNPHVNFSSELQLAARTAAMWLSLLLLWESSSNSFSVSLCFSLSLSVPLSLSLSLTVSLSLSLALSLSLSLTHMPARMHARVQTCISQAIQREHSISPKLFWPKLSWTPLKIRLLSPPLDVTDANECNLDTWVARSFCYAEHSVCLSTWQCNSFYMAVALKWQSTKENASKCCACRQKSQFLCREILPKADLISPCNIGLNLAYPWGHKTFCY